MWNLTKSSGTSSPIGCFPFGVDDEGHLLTHFLEQRTVIGGVFVFITGALDKVYGQGLESVDDRFGIVGIITVETEHNLHVGRIATRGLGRFLIRLILTFSTSL